MKHLGGGRRQRHGNARQFFKYQALEGGGREGRLDNGKARKFFEFQAFEGLAEGCPLGNAKPCIFFEFEAFGGGGKRRLIHGKVH